MQQASRKQASKQQCDKIEKTTGMMESNHTHQAKCLAKSKNSNHDPLLWVVYSGFVLDSCWIRLYAWACLRQAQAYMGIWAYGQIFRSKCGGAEAVAFSRIFCAGDRGGQEAVCVCGWMMGWIRTGTGPARIMPLGLYSLILSLAPYGQAGAGNPQPPTNKPPASQWAASQRAAGSGLVAQMDVRGPVGIGIRIGIQKYPEGRRIRALLRTRCTG